MLTKNIRYPIILFLLLLRLVSNLCVPLQTYRKRESNLISSYLLNYQPNEKKQFRFMPVLPCSHDQL